MQFLFNHIENELHEIGNEGDLINRVRLIADENDDESFPINTLDDANAYIKQYSSNLTYFASEDVKKHLETYGVKVRENESSDYVELMMDDHKCVEFEGQAWYLPDSISVMSLIIYELHEIILYQFPYEG
jgi:hypothetical protein